MLSRKDGSWFRAVLGSPDIRRRLAVTVCGIVVYRMLTHLPLPGFTQAELRLLVTGKLAQSPIFQLVDFYAGGAAITFSVVALGLFPLFEANGLVSTLANLIPAWKERANGREGSEGLAWINRLTVFVTVPLALAQAVIGELVLLPRMGLTRSLLLPSAANVAVLTAGAMFTVWLANLMSEDGIGSGAAMLLVANLISASLALIIKQYTGNVILLIGVIATMILLGVGKIALTEAQRRIPIQLPGRRVTGRKMVATHTSYVPLLLIPGSMHDAPQTTFSLITLGSLILTWLAPRLSGVVTEDTPLLYGGVILGLTTLLAFMLVNVRLFEDEFADGLKRRGEFVPGIHPGRETQEYYNRVYTRIILPGGLFTGLTAAAPWLMQAALMGAFPDVGPVFVLLTLPAVAPTFIDGAKQLRAEAIMRNYAGFLV